MFRRTLCASQRGTGRGEAVRNNHVLIDFENVHVRTLNLLQGEHFRVIVFLGPHDRQE